MISQRTPLTSREKLLIKQSFELVQPYSNSLTKLFYGRLFELRPDVRRLFKTSLEEQSRKLFDTLAIVIEALDQFEAIRPRLAELGRKHVTYGATPTDYDSVRAALLWALGQALEMGFDREMKAAWDHLLRAIAAAMLEGTVT